MPSAKGIRKPRYTLEIRDLAVSLYVATPSTTLGDVANQLNSQYHFDPKLSSDSVGRWVQSRGLMKSVDQQIINRLSIRRNRYGPKGVSELAVKKLSNWRRTLWADPDYKNDMKQRMRRVSEVVRQVIVKLYVEGKSPTQIRRVLCSSQAQFVPSLSVIHQILNDEHILKRLKTFPLPFERPTACLVCSSVKIKRSGYHCNPLGIKVEPRFQCQTCGTMFYKDHVCIKQKYPSYIKDFALTCRADKLKYIDISNIVKFKFGVYINPTTIRNWIHRLVGA